MEKYKLSSPENPLWQIAISLLAIANELAEINRDGLTVHSYKQ